MRFLPMLVAAGSISWVGQVYAQADAPELQQVQRELAAAEAQANRDITDVGLVRRFTGDMAKFYLAVGVMNAWECHHTGDPTICAGYYQQLRDPVGHVGFVLFAVAAQGASRGVLGLASVTQSETAMRAAGAMAGNLGLAAGLLVNDAFVEMYTSPEWRKYVAAYGERDPEKRVAIQKECLQNLWKKTLGDGRWWFNKIPDIASLAGAAMLSRATSWGALRLSSRAVQFVTEGEELRAIVRTSRAAETVSEVATWGVRLLKTGSSVTGVGLLLRVGGSVVETVVFLGWNEIIRDPLRKWWNETAKLKEIREQELSLFLRVQRFEALPRDDHLKKVEEAVLRAQNAWDKYRAFLRSHAAEIQQRHMIEMNHLREAPAELLLVYSWIAAGARDEKRPGGSFDGRARYVEQFFCGPPLDEAVQDIWSVWGIPVPGYGEPTVRPFRVVTEFVPDTCGISDYKSFRAYRNRGGSGLDYLHLRRVAYLQKHPELDARVIAMMARVFVEAQKIRDRVVGVYEQCIQKEMIRALTGDIVAVSNGRATVTKNNLEFYDYALPELAPIASDPSVPKEIAEKIMAAQEISMRKIESALGEIGGDHEVFPRAVMPAYDQELKFWHALQSKFETSVELQEVFESAIDRVEKKRAVAQGLLDYMRDLGDKKRRPVTQPIDAFIPTSPTEEDWRDVLVNWRKFIVD